MAVSNFYRKKIMGYFFIDLSYLNKKCFQFNAFQFTLTLVFYCRKIKIKIMWGGVLFSNFHTGFNSWGYDIQFRTMTNGWHLASEARPAEQRSYCLRDYIQTMRFIFCSTDIKQSHLQTHVDISIWKFV